MRAVTSGLRLARAFSSKASQTTEEARIAAKLLADAKLAPTAVEVVDTSGGCGAMYAIEVASNAFKDLSIVKQHKLVKDVIAEDVAKWHGFTLRTKTP